MRYTKPMAETHTLDEIVNRPGVYFNPQTEVLIVVDDSAELDGEIFNMEQFEGADWVAISDETPLDEQRRDELLEEFQTHYHPGDARSLTATGGQLEAVEDQRERVVAERERQHHEQRRDEERDLGARPDRDVDGQVHLVLARDVDGHPVLGDIAHDRDHDRADEELAEADRLGRLG